MRNRMMIMAVVGIMLLVVGCSTQRYDSEYVRDANWTSDGKIVYLVEKKSTWIQRNPIYEHQVKKETSVSLWECDSDGNNKEEKGIIIDNWIADIAYHGMSSVGEWVVMSMEDNVVEDPNEVLASIYKCKRNGDNLSKIGYGLYPSLSPDGSKVVYKEWGGGIKMMNIDGSNDHVFLDDTSLTAPQWSPDGGYIAVNQQNIRLKIYDINGELKKIFNKVNLDSDTIKYLIDDGYCWSREYSNDIYNIYLSNCFIRDTIVYRKSKILFNINNDSLEISYYDFKGMNFKVYNNKMIAYYGDILVSNIDGSNIWYLYTLLND